MYIILVKTKPLIHLLLVNTAKKYCLHPYLTDLLEVPSATANSLNCRTQSVEPILLINTTSLRK